MLTSQEQMQFISKRLRGQRRKDLERRATKGRIIKYEVRALCLTAVDMVIVNVCQNVERSFCSQGPAFSSDWQHFFSVASNFLYYPPYVQVNPKLQNFTFPREYNVAPMNVDEMFASLLGRRRSETTTPIHKEAEIL